jgi:hypothetical protein
MEHIHIKYKKWEKHCLKEFHKSCEKYLGLKQCQFYQPFFSIFFNIHNSPNSHKIFDLQRRFFIQSMSLIDKDYYHNSNIIIRGDILDTIQNRKVEKQIFCKCIPLLDPLSYLMNNYNNNIHRNPLLPSAYNYNTFEKLNDIENMAYIDTFFSFIASELTLRDVLPCFPIFYGSINGIKEEYKFDITEDFSHFQKKPWFYKERNNSFSINLYISSDEETNSESDSNSESETDYDNRGDYIAVLKKIPCQYFFIEMLEGTLEDLLPSLNEFNHHLILSCLFQISFSLAYLQKHYKFTHNDLHINNIMFQKTDKTFIYYKFNNKYFKVPTYGYLFKIIDFGRSIFTFHKKQYFNDSFKKHGEAGGQYDYPYDKLLFNSKDKLIQPNFHFDLCRLSITILDQLNYEKEKDYQDKQSFMDFIHEMTLNNNNESLFDMYDDFDLYISIAKDANHALPSLIIQHEIFTPFRVHKKNFPKKLYYHM